MPDRVRKWNELPFFIDNKENLIKSYEEKKQEIMGNYPMMQHEGDNDRASDFLRNSPTHSPLVKEKIIFSISDPVSSLSPNRKKLSNEEIEAQLKTQNMEKRNNDVDIEILKFTKELNFGGENETNSSEDDEDDYDENEVDKIIAKFEHLCVDEEEEDKINLIPESPSAHPIQISSPFNETQTSQLFEFPEPTDRSQNISFPNSNSPFSKNNQRVPKFVDSSKSLNLGLIGESENVLNARGLSGPLKILDGDNMFLSKSHNTAEKKKKAIEKLQLMANPILDHQFTIRDKY